MKDLFAVFHADIALSDLPGARYMIHQYQAGLFIPFKGDYLLRLVDNKCYLPLRTEGCFAYRAPVPVMADPPRNQIMRGPGMNEKLPRVGYFYRIFPDDCYKRPREARHANIHVSEKDIITII